MSVNFKPRSSKRSLTQFPCLKSRKQLTAEGSSLQWISYAPLREKFDKYKKMSEIEQYKTSFENELCTNDEHAIVKMYTLLLRNET